MTNIRKRRMMEEVHAITDKLSEVIGNMQKCLQCTICLHTVSDPVKTRCGHRFCRACIQTVLENKKAHCPLCNTAISRRSVTKDERMVLYVDRLQKLIQAIELDTGIDILAHLSRPPGNQKSYPQDSTERHKSSDREPIKPGCSNDSTAIPKNLVDSRSNRATQRRKRAPKGQKTKQKDVQKAGSSITKYLSKCAISGVEPLPPDEPDDCRNEKSLEEKVHSWLDNLPEIEALDDPDKVTPGEPVECDLDDTLTISVSQNDNRNKMDTSDKNGEAVAKKAEQISTRRTMTRQSSWSSILQENKGTEMNDKRKTRNKTKINMDIDNPKPSTSGVMRSRDVSRERSVDRSIDINKTSPCDLLPAMKKNWTMVREFGKEMRSKKKKKLKSLNVSIENKGRPRGAAEIATNIDKREIDRLMTEETGNRGVSKKVKTSIGTRKSSLDRQSLEKKQSSTNNENMLETEPIATNKGDRAMSAEIRMPGESSFIMLVEGEQVKIRNLNSCQMNDIIGISQDTQRKEIAKGTKTNPEKEQDDPPRTPLQDRFKNFPQGTPLKQSTLHGQESSVNNRGERQSNFSPFMLPEDENRSREEEMSQSCSRSVQQVSNSTRRRLSLRKGNGEVKSNDSTASYGDARLQAVKRDLNRDIDQSVRNTDEKKRTTDEKSGTGLYVCPETSKQDGKRTMGSAAVPNEFTSRNEGNGRRNGSTVVFKKLGKTFKSRKKHVNFLYLSAIRQESSLVCNFQRHGSLKPCNPIDVSDREDPARGFGNNAYFSVNYTPARETSQSANIVETEEETKKRVSKIKTSSDSPLKIAQQSTSKKLTEMAKNVQTKTQSSDVPFVTLDENEEIFHPSIDRPAKSPKKFTTNPIKLLSPTKDSQLRFLSLDSPDVENVQPREMIESPEPVKDIGSFSGIKGAHSRALIRALQHAPHSSGSPSTPRKKKRSRSRDNLSHGTKREEGEENDDYSPSSRSFPSRVTCIGNPDNEVPPIKRNKAIERCQASRANDIDIVTLSSDTDSPEGGLTGRKKVYKRIVTLGSSASSSAGVAACANKTANDQPVASPASKRKRNPSPDSDVEADLNVIASSWYEDAIPGERCKKRGKLEETRNPANSMNTTRNNSTSRSCSNDRNQMTNKLADWQNSGPVRIARNSVVERSQHVGTKWEQELEARVALLMDDDSPDFGETIDKMKDIRNKGVACQRKVKEDYLMQDNFDDVIANVNTEILLNDCTNDNVCKSERTLVEGLQRSRCDKNSSANVRSLGKVNLLGSNTFDKNNSCKDSAPLFDDTEKTLTPEYLSVAKKSFTKGKCKGKTEIGQSTGKTESARIEPNSSMVDNFVISTDENKFPIDDPAGKDTFEQDSLLNITQDYLMIKQFEEDLFGKPNSSNAGFAVKQTEQEQRTPRKTKKQGLKANGQDIEHLAEEDDIVENTPDTKTKNRSHQVTVSPKTESLSSSTVSQIFDARCPMERSSSSMSTIGPDDVNSSTFPKKIGPFHHSTPKVQQPVPRHNYSATKSISTISDPDQSKSDIEKNVQNVQTYVRRKFCFASSGLIPSQIEQVKRLAVSINAEYLTQFHRNVTHMIVKTESNNGANKTLKYLQGIAHQKWIVNYQWVLDSLKERRLINEEPYEVVDNRTLEAGPRKSRLRDKTLFEGFVFLCIGPYADVSVAQYQDLLRATGAIVVDSIDSMAVIKKMLKIIVVQADVHNDSIIGWYKETRAVPIVHDWVVECISQYKLISLYPYIQELSRQEVLALGYPDFLVEDEPDGDTDSLTNESM